MSIYRRYRGAVVTLLLANLLAQPVVAQSKMGKIVEHTIRKGETLYSLSHHYGVPLEKVYELNPWAKTQLREGDKVLFPTGEAYKKPSAPNAKTHEVQAGETIYRICRTYGISEEALLSANPHISLESFRVGTILSIPSGYTTLPDTVQRALPQVKLPTLMAEEEQRQTRILLMLPISTTPRNLEFYEGFLMGINDLKKDGLSMHLKVLDTPSDIAVSDAIDFGMLRGRDIIIGGINPQQISQISSAVGADATYIIPFNATEGNWSGVQLNQPQRVILDRVVAAFRRKYEGKELVLVKSDEHMGEDALVSKLKHAWAEAGLRVRVVSLDDPQTEALPSQSVLVPVSSHKALGTKLLEYMTRSGVRAEVFGYPQWQSYGDEFARRAHRVGATIYSTFFFDPEHKDSKQFLMKYKAWYNKKISNSYPKYSVLGYDLARYFVRSYAIYGKGYLTQAAMLPSDGLQMDIALEPHPTGKGYVNTKFYFVTYQTDGSIGRVSL